MRFSLISKVSPPACSWKCPLSDQIVAALAFYATTNDLITISLLIGTTSPKYSKWKSCYSSSYRKLFANFKSAGNKEPYYFWSWSARCSLNSKTKTSKTNILVQWPLNEKKNHFLCFGSNIIDCLLISIMISECLWNKTNLTVLVLCRRRILDVYGRAHFSLVV